MSVAIQIYLEFSEEGVMKYEVKDREGKPLRPMEAAGFPKAISNKEVVSLDTAVIAFAHASPGCVYFRLGGKYYRHCSP